MSRCPPRAPPLASRAAWCSVADQVCDHIERAEPMYLTAGELARQIQVDDKTVYRWAQEEPSMPVLRIRGVVRFPRERVLRWLTDHEQRQARRRGPHISSLRAESPQSASSSQLAARSMTREGDSASETTPPPKLRPASDVWRACQSAHHLPIATKRPWHVNQAPFAIAAAPSPPHQSLTSQEEETQWKSD